MTWPTARLGDVAEFRRGVTFKPEDVITLEGDDVVACFRTRNIQESLDLSDVWGLPASFSSAARILRESDILISTANSFNLVGKVCWTPALSYEAVPGGFIGAIRAKAEKLDPRYGYWWLSSKSGQATIRKCANQTTNIANISIPRLLDVKLPLPSRIEQRRIAEMLDEADNIRRLRAKSLCAANRLVQAMLAAMTEDLAEAPRQRLDQLVAVGDRINYGVVQPGDEYAGGSKLIRVANVVDEDFSAEALKRIDPKIEAGYSRSRLKGTEVLIACVGSIGAIAAVPASLAGANIARAVARVNPDPAKVERSYLVAVLRSDEIQQRFISETRTVAQPTLNIKQICELKVPVPSGAIQRDFAARVTEIEKVKTVQQAHLAELDALFASLQDRAFSDRL